MVIEIYVPSTFVPKKLTWCERVAPKGKLLEFPRPEYGHSKKKKE